MRCSSDHYYLTYTLTSNFPLQEQLFLLSHHQLSWELAKPCFLLWPYLSLGDFDHYHLVIAFLFLPLIVIRTHELPYLLVQTHGAVGRSSLIPRVLSREVINPAFNPYGKASLPIGVNPLIA